MNQGRPAYLEKQLQKIPAGELEVIHRSVFGQDHPHVTDRVLAKTKGKGRMEVYSVYPGIDVSYTAFLSAEATFHHAASPAIVECSTAIADAWAGICGRARRFIWAPGI